MTSKTHPCPSSLKTDSIQRQDQQETYFATVLSEENGTTSPEPPSNQTAATAALASDQYCCPTPPAAAAAVACYPRYIPIDSRKPVTLTCCPKCGKKNVATYTHTKANGTTAALVALGAFIFLPLCWLPLCITATKQTNHYCTSCGTKVGRVKPLQ